jgi:hypothetical protein
MVVVSTRVYVLRLAYCKNKFGEGNVGAVQSVFKRRWKSLDLPSQPALALLAMIVNDELGSFETPSWAPSLLSGVKIRTVMKWGCTFAHAIAFCWVSKNRSMMMAFRSIACRPHKRAALRLITAGPLSTATHSASGKTTYYHREFSLDRRRNALRAVVYRSKLRSHPNPLLGSSRP